MPAKQNRNDKALAEIRELFKTKTLGPNECGWRDGDPDSWGDDDTDKLIELVSEIDASLSRGGPLPAAWASKSRKAVTT